MRPLSANQLVAYNLRRARRMRGLTQEQAAVLLEPYLGRRWSKATFSAAETSVKGKRVREFSADVILAFAQVFDVPVGWFFLPPRGLPGVDVSCGGPHRVNIGAEDRGEIRGEIDGHVANLRALADLLETRQATA